MAYTAAEVPKQHNANIHDRILMLLTGIILYQYVILFAEGWLSITKSIVVSVLFAVCFISWIPRIHWGVRRCIEAIVIIAIHGLILHVPLISGYPVHSWTLFFNSLSDRFTQLTPFVWFGISAWFIYLYIQWWIRVKARVYILIMFSVLLFACVDSFSLIELWDQVAICILCGLLMLFTHHFANLKLKMPYVWERITDYPSSIALPAAMIVLIVMLCGFLSPTLKPLITDPYTVWKGLRGEVVITSGKPNGIVISKGNASSGYSRDDSKLGGAFDFDYATVMTVQTTQKSYWRGETDSFYTSEGWIQSDSDKSDPKVPVTADKQLPRNKLFDNSLMKTFETMQVITLEKKVAYPVLFGAFDIQKVGMTEREGGAATDLSPVTWRSQQGELLWDNGQSYPKKYTLISQVPIIDDAALRTAPLQLANPKQFKEYLQLPAELPERVGALANEITKGASTPYDKALLLASFLSKNYPYTNKPDLSKGISADFVDRFLFEIKAGYCDYYSTAMAVMARTVGLPSRWVKGFSSGSTPMDQISKTYNPNIPPLAVEDPNGAGLYTVRNSDAHSWVEIYFQGYGWIPFEPTAGFSLPVAHKDITRDPVSTADKDNITNKQTIPAASNKRITQWIVSLISAAVVAVIIIYLIVRFRLIDYIRYRSHRQMEIYMNHRLVNEFERFLRFAMRKGFLREEHETAREAIYRWTNQHKWLKKDLDTLLSLFERAKYSLAAITDDDLNITARIIKKLREEMK